MVEPRPIGYFVHHQGRGHAERAASIANLLIDRRPVTLFCARSDIFPDLDPRIERIAIPSLFEATGDEAPRMAALPMPETTHCAPIGWPSITKATATIAGWFARSHAALFVSDVSAELAQLARLCSVPHICVMQHGDRTDAGHRAAYEGAVGLLAPYHRRLEQSDREGWMARKTHYASGVGVDCSALPSMAEARRRLDLDPDADIVLVVAGGGGEGTPSAPLTLGARAKPDSQWITIGSVQSAWHETSPGNLAHRGWVDDPQNWIAAADRVVSSTGNTTVHMVLSVAKPWIVVPEWRYFDEQLRKAQILEREGLAIMSPQWPSHADGWARLWERMHDINHCAQRAIVDPDAAQGAAAWLDELAERLWAGTEEQNPKLEVVA